MTFDKDTLTISYEGQAGQGHRQARPGQEAEGHRRHHHPGEAGRGQGEGVARHLRSGQGRPEVVHSDPGEKERPTEFATKAGGKGVLFTLEKEKK